MKQSEINAAIIAEIYLGIAMARAAGIQCDNPSCCNPNHLEVGTVRDNSRDMMERGRHKPVRLRGEENPSCKISEDDVRIIKARILAGESNTQIANDYPISHAMVSNIRRGKSWAHI